MGEFNVVEILEDFEAIGMKVKHVAALADVSEATLGRARNGFTIMPGQDLLNMRRLLAECQELAARNPLPVAWTNLFAVREQLEILRQEKSNPPAPLTPEEANIIHEFAVGNSIEDLAVSLRLTREQLLERVSELLARSTRLAASQR